MGWKIWDRKKWSWWMGIQLCSSNKWHFRGKRSKSESKRLAAWVRPMSQQVFFSSLLNDAATYLDEPEASLCPSFFTFPELMSSVDLEELYDIQLNHKRMGHTRRKPTGLVSNLPGLPELDGLRGGGSTNEVTATWMAACRPQGLGQNGPLDFPPLFWKRSDFAPSFGEEGRG